MAISRVSSYLHCLALGVGASLLINCGGAELRGKSVPSPDGKTYLVVDDNNGGSCGPIQVDGRAWPFPLHTPGPIEPGVHKIQCGTSGGAEFEIKAAHTFHFNYWGP